MRQKRWSVFFLWFLLLVFALGCTSHDYTRAKGVAAYEQRRNIDLSSDYEPFLDSAGARITILSRENDKWKIRVDEIVDYTRWRGGTYPQLKEGDILDVPILGFIESYARKGFDTWRNCTLKQDSILANASRPLPTIEAGDRWSAKLDACDTRLHRGCKRDGWSAYLYNQDLIILEYECAPDELVD